MTLLVATFYAQKVPKAVLTVADQVCHNACTCTGSRNHSQSLQQQYIKKMVQWHSVKCGKNVSYSENDTKHRKRLLQFQYRFVAAVITDVAFFQLRAFHITYCVKFYLKPHIMCALTEDYKPVTLLALFWKWLFIIWHYFVRQLICIAEHRALAFFFKDNKQAVLLKPTKHF